jgi:hypothetical protein
VDGLINNLSFAPDGKRLFDVRGHYCNVWEPNVLIRVDERADHDSDAASDLPTLSTWSSHPVLESSSKIRDQISAIAIQSQGRYQAIGDEKGVISLVDSLEGSHKSIELWKSDVQLPIGHLAWSGDGNYLGSELAGQVVVKKVQSEQNLSWTASSIFSQRLRISIEGVSQLFLNDDGSKMFVKNGPEAIIFSVGDATEDPQSIDLAGFTWIEHPSNTGLLVAFNGTTIQLRRWEDLSILAAMKINGASALSADTTIKFVLRAARTQQMVIHSQIGDDASENFITSFFDIPPLDAFSTPEPSADAIAHDIPTDIEAQIELPLGILPIQGLIFLDRNYWLCSYKLGPSTEKQEIQKYYFLPKDFLNEECLRLCALLANGTLLIPNNGELAVIKCAGLR